MLAPMAAQGLVRVGDLGDDAGRRPGPDDGTARGRARSGGWQMIRRLTDGGRAGAGDGGAGGAGADGHELEPILEAARDAGAVAASWIMLRLPLEVAPLFRDWLAATRSRTARPR